ncbi:DUF559 domain-containing protein [Paramesorhizobium deserti]|uniref:DUF559 domain-containing protein n=1 Tax=Paramesorhizobium deserti TaxID=1494590 RepID=UPI0009E813B1
MLVGQRPPLACRPSPPQGGRLRFHQCAAPIADFVCPTHHLIVEIDGSHHGSPEQMADDERRTAHLQSRGYTILRFWNDDVIRDIDGVCQHIVTAAAETEEILQ